MTLRLLSLAALSLCFVGCPVAECVEDAERCEGEMVQHCHDGAWAEAEECADGMTCQAMGDDEHCMTGSM